MHVHCTSYFSRNLAATKLILYQSGKSTAAIASLVAVVTTPLMVIANLSVIQFLNILLHLLLFPRMKTVPIL